MVEPSVPGRLARLLHAQTLAHCENLLLALPRPGDRQTFRCRYLSPCDAVPVPLHVERRPAEQVLDGGRNGPAVVPALVHNGLQHVVSVRVVEHWKIRILPERPHYRLRVFRQRIWERLEHAPHHGEVLGEDHVLHRAEPLRKILAHVRRVVDEVLRPGDRLQLKAKRLADAVAPDILGKSHFPPPFMSKNILCYSKKICKGFRRDF